MLNFKMKIELVVKKIINVTAPTDILMKTMTLKTNINQGKLLWSILLKKET